MSLSQREHSSFQQTNAHSCGGAALLVALHDMTNFPLKQEREQQIWNFAKGTDQGSLPGRLALYATRRTVRVEVLNDGQRIQMMLTHIPRQLMELDPELLLREHEGALNKAAQKGIEITEGLIETELLFNRLQAGRVLIAVIVGQPPEQLGLHWLLLQCYDSETDELKIMDPGPGENLSFTKAHFNHKYFDPVFPRFLGSAIVITPETA